MTNTQEERRSAARHFPKIDQRRRKTEAFQNINRRDFHLNGFSSPHVLWFRENQMSVCVEVSSCPRPAQLSTIFDFFFFLPPPRITLRQPPYKLSPLPSHAPPRFNRIIWLAVTTSLAATQNLSPSLPLALFLPRLQRGVSMETRQRQRSVSEQKVHPGGEGGSAQILQQTGCEWNKNGSI